MNQCVQLVGSLAILTGFGLNQRGILAETSRTYLLLNLAGSSILACQTLRGPQWGFLLLEGVWAVVSAIGLAGTFRASRRQPKAD